MKKVSSTLRIVVFVVMLFGTPLLVAENKELHHRAEDIWRKAEEASTLDAGDTRPYRERAVFTLYTLRSGALKGTYTKEFADINDWVEDIRLSDYEKVSIRKDDNLYKHENADFTPLGVRNVTSALSPFKFVPVKKESVRKIRSTEMNGVAASCVDSEIDFGLIKQKFVTCVLATDGTVLSNSSSNSRSNTTTLYSDYVSFQGKLLPTHIDVIENGQKLLKADVVYSEQPRLTAASIQVPEGLQPEHPCKEPIPPEIKSRTDPSPPNGVDLHDLNRTVVVTIRVGTDGLVSRSAVLESAGSDFDRNAEETVRKWRFKPALCQGIPFETTVDVEINFHGYR